MDRPEEGEQRIETLIPKVETDPKGWRHKLFRLKIILHFQFLLPCDTGD